MREGERKKSWKRRERVEKEEWEGKQERKG